MLIAKVSRAKGSRVWEVEGFRPGDQFVADGVEGDYHGVLKMLSASLIRRPVSADY